jgi:DNA-directed RNA polymerase subunit RPC12/RpoP
MPNKMTDWKLYPDEYCDTCGHQGLLIKDDAATHTVTYRCPRCGEETEDGYEDLYGCMSVPWGGV